MYRRPVTREKDAQQFTLELCRAELFALHQALAKLQGKDCSDEHLNLRTFIQNLLYPSGSL